VAYVIHARWQTQTFWRLSPGLKAIWGNRPFIGGLIAFLRAIFFPFPNSSRAWIGFLPIPNAQDAKRGEAELNVPFDAAPVSGNMLIAMNVLISKFVNTIILSSRL
jgi:hypothetical protein